MSLVCFPGTGKFQVGRFHSQHAVLSCMLYAAVGKSPGPGITGTIVSLWVQSQKGRWPFWRTLPVIFVCYKTHLLILVYI